jgi:hypothetical protein
MKMLRQIWNTYPKTSVLLVLGAGWDLFWLYKVVSL